MLQHLSDVEEKNKAITAIRTIVDASELTSNAKQLWYISLKKASIEQLHDIHKGLTKHKRSLMVLTEELVKSYTKTMAAATASK